MELLANAARDAGFEDRPEYEVQLEFLKMQALRTAYVEEIIMVPVSDEELQAGYQANVVDRFTPEEEVRARHILVETQEEAIGIIDQLNQGAAFEELAAASKDVATVPRGGDLGFFARGQMVPAFEDAAFALAPGEFTPEPVESQFGWHVIKVEETRMTAPPPLEEVADQLTAYLQQQNFEAKLAELHDRYEVEILEEPVLPQ
jgi:peptidyl-prolyl cis-trans isomerase C